VTAAEGVSRSRAGISGSPRRDPFAIDDRDARRRLRFGFRRARRGDDDLIGDDRGNGHDDPPVDEPVVTEGLAARYGSEAHAPRLDPAEETDD
jgi:hypothetical protein